MTQVMVVDVLPAAAANAAAAQGVAAQSGAAAASAAATPAGTDAFVAALEQALLAIGSGAGLEDVFRMPEAVPSAGQSPDALKAVALENLAAGKMPKELLDMISSMRPVVADSGDAVAAPAGEGEPRENAVEEKPREIGGVTSLLDYLAALIAPLVNAAPVVVPDEVPQAAPDADVADNTAGLVPEAASRVARSMAPAAQVPMPAGSQQTSGGDVPVPKPDADVQRADVQPADANPAKAQAGEAPRTSDDDVAKLAEGFGKALEVVSAKPAAPQLHADAPDARPADPPDRPAQPAVKPADAGPESPVAAAVTAGKTQVADVAPDAVVEVTPAKTAAVEPAKAAAKDAAPERKPSDAVQPAPAAGPQPLQDAAAAAQSPAAQMSAQAAVAVPPAQKAVRPAAPAESEDSAIDAVRTLPADAAAKPSDAGGARTHAPVGADQERVIARIASAISQAEQSGKTTVRMRLYPPEMGTVRIEVTSVRGAVSARIETSTPATQGVLQSNLASLRADLRDAGVDVRDMRVQYRDPSSAFGPESRSAGRGAHDERRNQRRPAAEERQSVEPVASYAQLSEPDGLNLFI
jgi:flagellar hook-length control protein FliK